MFEGTSKYFKQLEHLHMLPQAYKECLIEVSQRRNYNALFQVKVNAMLDTVATIREEEGARRRKFRSTYGVHIPANIFPGLLGGAQEKAPQCHVVFDSSLDKDLPAIDLADLAGPSVMAGGGPGPGGGTDKSNTAAATAPHGGQHDEGRGGGHPNVFLQGFSEQHAEVRRIFCTEIALPSDYFVLKQPNRLNICTEISLLTE
jgi:hypothetical protein